MHLKTRSEGGDGLAIAKRREAPACTSAKDRALIKLKTKLDWGRQHPGCIILPDGNWGPVPLLEKKIGTMMSGQMFLPNRKWGKVPEIGTVMDGLSLWPNMKWDGAPLLEKEPGRIVSGFVYFPNHKWVPQAEAPSGKENWHEDEWDGLCLERVRY
ncbi:hypothetical protein F5887DRAFT_1074879 [Amanita rubescens]|nr:hypothetical protein F5887DRAFT_1074879 [Amanita rubescens]